MANLNLLDLSRVLQDNSNQRLKLVRTHLMFADAPKFVVRHYNTEYEFPFTRDGKLLTIVEVNAVMACDTAPADERTRKLQEASVSSNAVLCFRMLAQALAEVGYIVADVVNLEELEVEWLPA